MNKITEGSLLDFKECLYNDEKSRATVVKYVRSVELLSEYLAGEEITKERLIEYRDGLLESRKAQTVNGCLSAINAYLNYCGMPEMRLRLLKVQRQAFLEESRELSRKEYERLLSAARGRKDERMYLILLTLGCTGIRISELRFITVEALHVRKATVSLKGKTRIVILPVGLCMGLKRYIREKNITSGSIFVTRTGKPIDRSNILHGMKALCEAAKVLKSKVSPHNLRHLFALTYYKVERDICHLADLLGHSNINTTRIYTMVSCEEQEQQIDCLGLFIGT